MSQLKDTDRLPNQHDDHLSGEGNHNSYFSWRTMLSLKRTFLLSIDQVLAKVPTFSLLYTQSESRDTICNHARSTLDNTINSSMSTLSRNSIVLHGPTLDESSQHTDDRSVMAEHSRSQRDGVIRCSPTYCTSGQRFFPFPLEGISSTCSPSDALTDAPRKANLIYETTWRTYPFPSRVCVQDPTSHACGLHHDPRFSAGPPLPLDDSYVAHYLAGIVPPPSLPRLRPDALEFIPTSIKGKSCPTRPFLDALSPVTLPSVSDSEDYENTMDLINLTEPTYPDFGFIADCWSTTSLLDC